MNNDELIDKLSSLAKLDIDAAHAYEQSLDEIDVPDVQARFVGFHDDHERHIDEIFMAITTLGGTPPERTRDFKGFLIQGFVAISKLGGTDACLKSMASNERLTNEKYKEATTWTAPADIAEMIENNCRDERRHLEFIEQCVSAGVGK